MVYILFEIKEYSVKYFDININIGTLIIYCLRQKTQSYKIKKRISQEFDREYDPTMRE